MCQFKSAIVLKNGDVLHLDGVDSHEDIMEHHGVKDNDYICRVEFVPGENMADVKKYKLKIDQERPKWFTENVERKATTRLRQIIKKYIVTEDKNVLPVGFFILGNVTIEDAGYSTIEDAGHSTIEDAGHSTIKNAGHSTIKNAGHSTIEHAGHSTEGL